LKRLVQFQIHYQPPRQVVKKYSSIKTKVSFNLMITDDITYGTSTNLADVASSKIHDITTMEVFTSSEISILSTMIVNQPEQCKLLTYFI
jgi:hypothetical protein